MNKQADIRHEKEVTTEMKQSAKSATSRITSSVNLK